MEEADLEQAFDAPSVIEEWVDFEKEIAVIVSRNDNGDTSAFPCVEMEFNAEANLVELLISPAQLPFEVQQRAEELAIKIAEDLQIVGLLAVEMFLTKEGGILVNELAPRPHNSGHYTIDACATSQFEQQVRALSGLPLGATDMLSAAAMVNVLGDALRDALDPRQLPLR